MRMKAFIFNSVLNNAGTLLIRNLNMEVLS